MPWRFSGGDGGSKCTTVLRVASEGVYMRAIIQRELHITTTEYVLTCHEVINVKVSRLEPNA